MLGFWLESAVPTLIGCPVTPSWRACAARWSDVDDDRTLRRAVVEQLRRTVPFDAFAWLLTDPDTTVGTAPLAEVPCLDQSLHVWWHSATRQRTSLDRRPVPGVPYRPVPPGSELAQFLAGYGTYDVVSLAFADRFGWWGFLDLWREGGQFRRPGAASCSNSSAEPVTTALRTVTCGHLRPA